MIESVLSSLFTLENLLWINVGLAGGIMAVSYTHLRAHET